jgi:endonuclease/exonuclease/phosphatase family metal-dependent hydrolase
MPTKLAFTTWNVQNLFRPDLADQDAVEAYDEKLGLLAGTIDTLDPDVIALQEVGSEGALTDLKARLGGAYPHHHYSVPDDRGIACAFVSKLKVQSHEDIVDFPKAVLDLGVLGIDGKPTTRLGRGAPRIRVKKGALTIDLIAVHLKSKLLTFPGGKFTTKDETLRARVASLALMRRTAEAATVRIAASALIANNEKRAVVVLGDFNDGPDAATTQIFQGPDGSELGTGGFDRPDAGDTARLWNLAARIDEARRFSRIHNGQGELLDQIFVSEELLPRVNGKRRLPEVDSLVDSITSIGDNPNTDKRAHPDHAPVTSTFELP